MNRFMTASRGFPGTLIVVVRTLVGATGLSKLVVIPSLRLAIFNMISPTLYALANRSACAHVLLSIPLDLLSCSIVRRR